MDLQYVDSIHTHRTHGKSVVRNKGCRATKTVLKKTPQLQLLGNVSITQTAALGMTVAGREGCGKE